MGAGELVKVGQKLTSENHLSTTVNGGSISNKTTSFIAQANAVLGTSSQPQAYEEEKTVN
jgi:hypothetical protein